MARAHEEQRIVLELTEDEACAVFSLIDHVTDGEVVPNELYDVYGALSKAGVYNAYTREELGLPAQPEDEDE